MFTRVLLIFILLSTALARADAPALVPEAQRADFVLIEKAEPRQEFDRPRPHPSGYVKEIMRAGRNSARAGNPC